MDYYIQALFGWQGRFNRLQYFGYTILSTVIALLLIAITSSLFNVSDTTISILSVPGLSLVIFGYVYSSMAITAKRLHDLGYGAINVLWIWLLNIAGNEIDQLYPYPVIGIILSILVLAVSVYLLAAPGVIGSNKYGDQPTGFKI